LYSISMINIQEKKLCIFGKLIFFYGSKLQPEMPEPKIN